ncbi:MAG TPA: UbiD family decarboxylase [Pyrinomonadaceae bacterium]|nr:UbiD family decarboxylase [Chloracidobacterium sp.]MBP9936002.1 UbiD family decarboxylase [Pyrinomonadaceae bacterium]MBK7803887.1 UbiD family decarboxylase [Chloracidobacterium sp.]MBK9439442.1 UbiD family decarboxylase [Chloracidobacterium sp.]MBK9768281.1 UbiD family decarboxylase [Chloracidobacterium sp.]
MHKNLRSFIELLRRENEIIEVSAEVDPYLEIAEIHRRVIDEHGKALLFTNVKGSKFPVVTNLFGTKRRIDLAFGPKPLDFVKRAVHAAETLIPPKLGKLWEFRDLAVRAAKLGTKSVRNAPVLDARQPAVDLEQLPLLQLWHEDGGHFVTLPLVYTESPVDKKPNLGMYRIQRYDKSTTGMHWQIGKGGGFHYYEAEQRNESLPVTIFVGGPPALILSAIAPLPEGLPELMLASLLADGKIATAANPLGADRHRLIAEAEFAICGAVAPHERRPEGPFGDHYGYYSLVHDYPVFRADAVFHRKDAIYPATVVGKPRQEDFFIGDYLQELLSPLFPLVMPAVRDLWSYGETGFHSLAAAVVRERYGREALSAGFRILGEGQLTLTKFLLLTDKPQDLRDFRTLFEYILARADWHRDLFVFSQTAFDTLDYASGKVNFGSKAMLIGTGEAKRELIREFRGDLPDGISAAEPFCGGCLVVEGCSYESDKTLAERVAKCGKFDEWQMVILHDDVAFARSTEKFLWATWTRFDPASDIYAREVTLQNNHIGYGGPIVIDARMKPWYPDVVEPREDIVELVDRRWGEYFS